MIIDMEKLPEKKTTKKTSLIIPESGVMAIDARRELVKNNQVMMNLAPAERYILTASAKNPIAEIDNINLVKKTAQLFQFIAIDVGYNIPNNENDWAYLQTRLLDILKKYYKYMTLAEVKLAFELAMTGDLDEYLPRDSQGNPDKKHYQQFNADYFGKILGAYKKRKNEVMAKAYQLLPAKQNKIDPKYQKQRNEKNRLIFLRYKYTGKLSLGIIDDMFVCKWLQEKGFVDEIEISNDDRNAAYQNFMKRVVCGMVNRYTAYQVRKDGIRSPEIDFIAFEIARKKIIQKTFDEMINEEVQI